MVGLSCRNKVLWFAGSVALPLVSLLQISCGSRTQLPVFGMGDQATVGRYVYSVLEAQWVDRLGEGTAVRMPQNHFLLARVSVTNSSNRDFFVPQLALVAQDGREYQELSEVEGLPGWFGVLRELSPGETESGWVVFDAPRADYRLRVTDDEMDSSEAKAALIEIPVRMATSTQKEPWGSPGP